MMLPVNGPRMRTNAFESISTPSVNLDSQPISSSAFGAIDNSESAGFMMSAAGPNHGDEGGTAGEDHRGLNQDMSQDITRSLIDALQQNTLLHQQSVDSRVIQSQSERPQYTSRFSNFQSSVATNHLQSQSEQPPQLSSLSDWHTSGTTQQVGNTPFLYPSTPRSDQAVGVVSQRSSAACSPAIASGAASLAVGSANINTAPIASPMDSDSLLHNSCKLYPETYGIVDSALQLDSDAIRRRFPVACETPGNNRPTELYSYPINIALRHNANLEIIQLLAASGPDVLVKPDGPSGGDSLSIALSFMKHASRAADVIDVLLSENKECASIADRNNNFPLHNAVRNLYATLDIIAAVHEAFPDALKIRNKNGETPLDVAIRSHHCPEPIVDFLQKLSYGHMEHHADHLEDDEDDPYAMGMYD